MLMHFDPFRELDRLSEGGRTRKPLMAMDAYRQGDRFVIDLDLPGVDPTTIDLTVDKNVLTVAAHRASARPEGKDLVVGERAQGSFSRQLFLGEGIDLDRIEASYHNGVLTIAAPVAEKAKARRVEITTTPSDSAPSDATAVAA